MSVNNYGNIVLQLCKSLELLIANGRLGKDQGTGALTCKNSTVVDYCILSSVLFGSAYIPPENSDYSSIDIFDVLESEIIKYTSETSCNVCLLGDFNEHTWTKSDFTKFNDYVCSSVQLENVINTVSAESLGTDTTRYDLDLSVNNYGNRLLQLCKSLELLSLITVFCHLFYFHMLLILKFYHLII